MFNYLRSSGILYRTYRAKFSLAFILYCWSGELSVFLAAVTGAGLGFLWYNCYPAQIFMGDTGSFFLGAVIALSAIATRS